MFIQGENPGDKHISNDAEPRIMVMVTLMNGQLARVDPISSEIAAINGGLGQLSTKLEGAITEVKAYAGRSRFSEKRTREDAT